MKLQRGENKIKVIPDRLKSQYASFVEANNHSIFFACKPSWVEAFTRLIQNLSADITFIYYSRSLWWCQKLSNYLFFSLLIFCLLSHAEISFIFLSPYKNPIFEQISWFSYTMLLAMMSRQWNKVQRLLL